jgi:hypothetical protein
MKDGRSDRGVKLLFTVQGIVDLGRSLLVDLLKACDHVCHVR